MFLKQTLLFILAALQTALSVNDVIKPLTINCQQLGFVQLLHNLRTFSQELKANDTYLAAW